jgi:hypothetical protein
MIDALRRRFDSKKKKEGSAGQGHPQGIDT